jgi:hypothetical protein
MMEVLLAIKQDIGEIKGSLSGHVKAFDDHVQMDEKAYHAISEIRQQQAKQKGFIAAMGAVGGGVVAALGYVIDKMWGGH